MRFAEGPKHLDPASGCQRCSLPGHPGLADARRSHHIHDTTAATDRAVHDGVEGGHLPAPTDQARLGATDQAIAAGSIATSRRARTGSSAPLMCTHSGSASITVCSTSRAVDSESITPPGGATDSIRCANPTASPIAA